MERSVTRMGAELDEWTKAENKAGRKLTEMGALKPERFGTAGKPKFALKGGETNAFLELVAEKLLVDPMKREALGPDVGYVIFSG